MPADLSRLVDEFGKAERHHGVMKIRRCTDAEFDLAVDDAERTKRTMLAAIAEIVEERDNAQRYAVAESSKAHQEILELRTQLEEARQEVERLRIENTRLEQQNHDLTIGYNAAVHELKRTR